MAKALRDSPVGQPVLRLNPQLFLLVSLVLAGFVAVFPYRMDLNPGGVPVGLDVHLYINWLSQMVSRTSIDALGYAFTGPGPSSRPLLLILLYSASLFTGFQPPVLVEGLPIFLSLGLVWSSYLFVRLGAGGKQMAALTAILTASSSAATVGIWRATMQTGLGSLRPICS